MINCDDYGKDESGFTLSKEDFIKKWAEVKLPSYVRFSCEWICAKFGCKITSLTQDIEPICPPREIYSKTWEQNIGPNQVSGHKTIVRVETDKGLKV